MLIHSTAQSPCLACGKLLHRRRTRPPTVCSSPGLPSDQEDRGRRGFIHFARTFVSSSCAVCALPENVCRRRLCAGALLVLVVFVFACEASGMSQARVTDFYSRTKKATGGPTKPTEPRSAFSCSSTVHEEFLRVIDEAAGLNHGAEQPLSSPRTPKRGSADLGATVSAAAVEHSTAKKRRQADLGAPAAAAGAERPARRSARKKLELPADTAQVTDVCMYTQTHRLCPAFTL